MDRASVEKAIAHLDALFEQGKIDQSIHELERGRLEQRLQELLADDPAALEALQRQQRATQQADAASSLDIFATGAVGGGAPAAPAPPHPSPQPAVIGADVFATGAVGGAAQQAPASAGAGLLGSDVLATGAVSQLRPTERAPAAQVSPLIGGRYRIIQELGRGGMGCVYQAFDEQQQEHIAIKTIAAHLIGTEWSEQWLQELQLHGRLRHPNIAPMRQLERDHELGFFVTMELIEGHDVERYIQATKRANKKKPFDLPTAIMILEQVAAALDHAHEQGIVHLDIKPSNILLQRPEMTPELLAQPGRPTRLTFEAARLIDFGIAKLRSGGTQGQVLGTVYYMPPEQLNGMGPLTSASDVYALGILAYQLLTGQIFQGGMPGPSELNNALTPAVDDVHQQAVSYKATDRFQRAGAFVDALKQAQKQRRKVSVPVPSAADVGQAVAQGLQVVGEWVRSAVALVELEGASVSEQKWPQIKDRIERKRPSWLEIPFARKAPRVAPASAFPKDTWASWPVAPLPKSLMLMDRQERPLLECCAIPPGRFLMGAERNDRSAKRQEKPQTKVTMSGYWMARHPVTHAAWHAFLEESQYQPAGELHPAYLPGWSGGKPPVSLQAMPVTGISMIDAWAFCDYYGLSLPSEAQWEYAARGDDGRPFPWGDEIPISGLSDGMPAHNCRQRKANMNVGLYPAGASPFGLLDTIWPVSQWCADEFDARWLRQVKETDPVLLGKRREGFFSIRGASWSTPPEQAQVYRRDSASPDACLEHLGFRPCLDLSI